MVKVYLSMRIYSGLKYHFLLVLHLKLYPRFSDHLVVEIIHVPSFMCDACVSRIEFSLSFFLQLCVCVGVLIYSFTVYAVYKYRVQFFFISFSLHQKFCRILISSVQMYKCRRKIFLCLYWRLRHI